MLEIGIKASAFSLPDQDGEMRSLADYQGQKVILYMNSRKPFVPATTRLPGRLGKYDLTYDVKFIATKEPLEIK